MTPERDNVTPWRDYMRYEGHSDATIRRRISTIIGLETRYGVDPVQLTMTQITSWIGGFTAQATKAAYFGDLTAYYRYQAILDDEFEPPTSRLTSPRQPKHRPRPITTDQLHLGLSSAKGDLRTQIELGAFQGLRVGEIAATAGDDIDGDVMTVLGKGGTSKAIPLHEILADAAATRPRSGYWFPGRFRGKHITATTIYVHMVEHFTQCGVIGFTPHRLRHWCGTEMLRAGASLREVQEFLRHDDIASTARYTLVVLDDLRSAVRRLPTPPLHHAI